MQRPEPSEYEEYYGTYVHKVPDGEILDLLDQGIRRTLQVLGDLPIESETFSYAPGKWTLREVVGHMVDTERVFSYRALSIARQDPSPLPGMDQDPWVAHSNARSRSLASLLAEFEATRRSSIALFASFDEAMWPLRGEASGCEFSVRAFPYIVAGHEIHHLQVLEKRYLPSLDA